MPRRVAVITGGRADYGLLRPLLRALVDDPVFELDVIVTGMHLVPEQGETWREVERDGFRIAEKVNLDIAGDRPTAIARAIGTGVAGMSDAFARMRPDIVVLLGDRFEIFAAAVAAMIARIPIAHIHGGEATYGAMDEAIRHSITKMAQWHCTSTEAYRRRVIQLGEAPERVFFVGAIGLDNIRTTALLDRAALERSLQFTLGKPTFLVTFHPVTLEPNSADQVDALLAALDEFPQARVVVTLPNVDTDSRAIRARLTAYASDNQGRVAAFAALGTERYLSMLAHCDAVIGNSSSGFIEAPSFRVPTVNIGDRQMGRIAPPSVIHCRPTRDEIRQAIRRALDPKFIASLRDMKNPYGDGYATSRIVDVLRSVPLGEGAIKKQFYDLAEVAA